MSGDNIMGIQRIRRFAKSPLGFADGDEFFVSFAAFEDLSCRFLSFSKSCFLTKFQYRASKHKSLVFQVIGCLFVIFEDSQDILCLKGGADTLTKRLYPV